MAIRKPKDLARRFHDIGDDFSKHPLGSLVAFTFLGLFISLPFFFLLYPASIAYEFLTGQNWPSTLALVAVVVSTAVIFLTMRLSSLARIAYLLALTATLNYLVFVETVSGLGMLFAVLSCAGITVVAATIILLTFGLRE